MRPEPETEGLVSAGARKVQSQVVGGFTSYDTGNGSHRYQVLGTLRLV